MAITVQTETEADISKLLAGLVERVSAAAEPEIEALKAQIRSLNAEVEAIASCSEFYILFARDGSSGPGHSTSCAFGYHGTGTLPQVLPAAIEAYTQKYPNSKHTFMFIHRVLSPDFARPMSMYKYETWSYEAMLKGLAILPKLCDELRSGELRIIPKDRYEFVEY